MLSQAHIYIKGDVIGVGMRAWMKIQAKLHNIKGWVRNVYEKADVFGPGGGVEAVLQGEEEDVVKMIEVVKEGPAIAHVQEVEIFQQDPKEFFEEFKIKK
jgi:acylphosphatase